MEFIYKDGISQAFLRAVTDLIELRIGEVEVEIIRNNRFILVVSESPGTVISNFYSLPSEIRNPNHLIIVDKVIFRHCDFNVEEIAATILHEIGHVLNEPDNIIEKEFYADFYAKRLGFARPLASSLEKYTDSELPYLTEEIREEITNRIIQLNDRDQEALEGHIKLLRYPEV